MCQRTVIPALQYRLSVISKKRRQDNKLYWNEPSTKQYQQKFSNPFYRSDTVTVNNAQSLPQHLLHTIVNNNIFSCNGPIQLCVLFNEEINMVTTKETTTNMMSK